VKKLSFIIACCIFYFMGTLGLVGAETLYGEDLAWRLANPSDIREVTTIKARLRKESKTAEPLFVLTPPPFDEIQAAPNEMAALTTTPKSWDLPPWPAVDPALPDNISQATQEVLANRSPSNADSGVWAELEPAEKETPSALLRPRVVPLDQQFVFRIKEIPEPFSLRRYYDDEDIFFQVAAYGGTTSFKAEEAFRAMKEAATRQTLLEGLGQEAFLTRIEITDQPVDTGEVPFEDLPVKGEARPDLMDSGQSAALAAPAFQSVPVKDLEGRTITYVEPHKRYKSGPEVKQSLIVVVAFFPDSAVTVSLAVEERLGSVQDLVALALMVQRKLKDEIQPTV
jgi:hypothetical protein